MGALSVGPAPGDVLHGHRLIEKLGEGGYGQVWKAEYYGTPVALKLFHAPKARVRSEALAAYRLGRLEGDDRRFFPRIEHIDLDADPPYLRMELLDGVPLDRYLTEHAELDTEARLSLANQLLHALEVVHRNGFIHGDLSPANVVVSPRGALWLIDVGFGAAFEEDAVRASVSTEGALGAASPLYAAPERFERAFRECGKAADVYSFGKILYLILTGEPPDAIKPLSRFRPDLARWEEFVYRCVEHDPAKRPPDAGAAREEMAALRGAAIAQPRFRAVCPACGTENQMADRDLGEERSCRSCRKGMEVLFFDVDAGEAVVRGSGRIVSRVRVEPVRAGERRPEARRPSPAPETGPRFQMPDYVPIAIVTFFLFFLLWVPGAIATLVFYFRGREIRNRTGYFPPGFGLISFFFWALVVFPLGLLAMGAAVYTSMHARALAVERSITFEEIRRTGPQLLHSFEIPEWNRRTFQFLPGPCCPGPDGGSGLPPRPRPCDPWSVGRWERHLPSSTPFRAGS